MIYSLVLDRINSKELTSSESYICEGLISKYDIVWDKYLNTRFVRDLDPKTPKINLAKELIYKGVN